MGLCMNVIANSNEKVPDIHRNSLFIIGITKYSIQCALRVPFQAHSSQKIPESRREMQRESRIEGHLPGALR